MPKRLTRDQRGFTLIELLIVILLIGVLAAIAIPMFTGKRQTAESAEAKSAARNLMTHVESCFVPGEDFRRCATKADVEAHEVDWGAGPGQVRVTDTTKGTYALEAIARNGESFAIARSAARGIERTCSGGQGCRDGEW